MKIVFIIEKKDSIYRCLTSFEFEYMSQAANGDS